MEHSDTSFFTLLAQKFELRLKEKVPFTAPVFTKVEAAELPCFEIFCV